MYATTEAYKIVVWAILVTVLVNSLNIHIDDLWSVFHGKIQPLKYLIHLLITCCIIVEGNFIGWTYAIKAGTAARPHDNS